MSNINNEPLTAYEVKRMGSAEIKELEEKMKDFIPPWTAFANMLVYVLENASNFDSECQKCNWYIDYAKSEIRRMGKRIDNLHVDKEYMQLNDKEKFLRLLEMKAKLQKL